MNYARYTQIEDMLDHIHARFWYLLGRERADKYRAQLSRVAYAKGYVGSK